MSIKRGLVPRWVLAAALFAAAASVLAQPANSPSTPSSASTASGERSTPKAQSAEQDNQEKNENDAYRLSPMVAKLGSMVGMNASQSATVFEITNFLLLAVLVLWALVKLVPSTIRNRNSAIQKHLVDARTATEEAGARLSSVEVRLGKLDGEIAGLRAQAEQDSARDEARIQAAVEEEKTKIVAAAEQEIVSATTQAHKRLQQYAAELAIEQAARKLVVSAETDRLLVQSFAQRLAGDESKKGQN